VAPTVDEEGDTYSDRSRSLNDSKLGGTTAGADEQLGRSWFGVE
jgi:hypothetical protein